MKLSEFIQENRAELETAIGLDYDESGLDEEEIENWIMKDEGLYNWALQNGVYDI